MHEAFVEYDLPEQERWKLYAVLAMWPCYVLLLPWIYTTIGFWSILLIIFPGVFLWTWMGVFAHECIHQYLPNVPHGRVYRCLCLMLFAHPEYYRREHAVHHIQVNSYRDTHIYPFGKIQGRFRRAIFNFCEIVFGDMFVFTAMTLKPARRSMEQRDRDQRLSLVPLVQSVTLFAALCCTTFLIFRVRLLDIAVAHWISFWVCGLFMRHSLMIQHRNVIAEGNQQQRALWTRNLLPTGICARLFLFLTHHDCQNHVLHHVQSPVHSRIAQNRVPLPDGAVHITMNDYGRVLKDMLLGRA